MFKSELLREDTLFWSFCAQNSEDILFRPKVYPIYCTGTQKKRNKKMLYGEEYRIIDAPSPHPRGAVWTRVTT